MFAQIKRAFDYLFHHRIKIFALWSTLLTGVFIYLGIYLWYLHSQVTINELGLNEIRSQISRQELSYDNFLFADHLSQIENLKLNQVKDQFETEISKLKSEEKTEKLEKIETIFSLYQDFLAKVERNNGSNISTSEQTDKLDEWGRKLLSQDYDTLQTEITESIATIEKSYQTYLASLKPVIPAPQPQPTAPAPTTTPAAPGYSFQTVATARGNFSVYLIKMTLAEVTVKTLSSNSENCTNDCPAKPLNEYVGEVGGYAGINGSYFCPPDYASCSGKINSFDFPVYNSNLGKWLNSAALGWNSVGLMTFNGSSASAYYQAFEYGQTAVTAGIGNFPPLLVTGGQTTIEDKNLTSYQKDVKGPRGMLGIDGSNVYLAIVSNANLYDAAETMKVLGATNVLNLDGGGSSALYVNGQYKVGPGRRLPNAVVLVK